MPTPGPDRVVSDERFLLELWLLGERKIVAREICEQIELDIQQTRDRLNELVENPEQNWVDVRKLSGRNLYDLTDEGRTYIGRYLRELVD